LWLKLQCASDIPLGPLETHESQVAISGSSMARTAVLSPRTTDVH
jgi:hypothetical protein